MRTPRSQTPAVRFLGVRLTQEELDRLDGWRTAHGNPSRSDAVRALLRAPDPAPAPGAVELPVSLRAQLEELVEDGWATNEAAALTVALTMGLEQVARLHAERLPALKRRAREHADRSDQRRRADREGRGLLER